MPNIDAKKINKGYNCGVLDQVGTYIADTSHWGKRDTYARAGSEHNARRR